MLHIPYDLSPSAERCIRGSCEPSPPDNTAHLVSHHSRHSAMLLFTSFSGMELSGTRTISLRRALTLSLSAMPPVLGQVDKPEWHPLRALNRDLDARIVPAQPATTVARHEIQTTSAPFGAEPIAPVEPLDGPGEPSMSMVDRSWPCDAPLQLWLPGARQKTPHAPRQVCIQRCAATGPLSSPAAGSH